MPPFHQWEQGWWAYTSRMSINLGAQTPAYQIGYQNAQTGQPLSANPYPFEPMPPPAPPPPAPLPLPPPPPPPPPAPPPPPPVVNGQVLLYPLPDRQGPPVSINRPTPVLTPDPRQPIQSARVGIGTRLLLWPRGQQPVMGVQGDALGGITVTGPFDVLRGTDPANQASPGDLNFPGYPIGAYQITVTAQANPPPPPPWQQGPWQQGPWQQQGPPPPPQGSFGLGALGDLLLLKLLGKKKKKSGGLF